MLKAAIIDDGVNRRLTANWLITAETIRRMEDEELIKASQEEGHADKCFKVIEHYLTDEAIQKISWHSIKILYGESLRGNIDSFIRALEFCLEARIKFIHLSIGSSHAEDFEKIEAIIAKLLYNKTIIVAAANNSGIITYPACLDGVFGVKRNPFFKGRQFSICSAPYDGINYFASASHYIDQAYVPKSNSFAAPLISSIILSYLVVNPNASIEKVQQILKKAKHQPKKHNTIIEGLENYNNFFDILQQELNNPKRESSSPIVVFTGFSESEMLTVIQGIYKQFCGDGYYVKVVTDLPATLDHGFYRISPTLRTNECLFSLSHFFQCDVLLAGIMGNGSAIQQSEDILLVTNSKRKNSEYVSVQNILYWDHDNYKTLYQRLIMILS